MSVSFLIPSRNRVELLKKSITSIVDTYEFTVDFDIMIRMDFDQADQCDQIIDWVHRNSYQDFVKVFCGYRYYYENILMNYHRCLIKNGFGCGTMKH